MGAGLVLLDDEAAAEEVEAVIVPFARFDVPIVCAYGGVDPALPF